MMRSWWRTFLVLLVLGLALGIRAQAQDHPNLASGFTPGQVYDFGGLENVNLLNGALNLTIPIGQPYGANGNLSYGLTLV